MKKCFERVCSLVKEKVSLGYGITSPQAQELETVISGFENALVDSGAFPSEWAHKHSIGKGNLASVMWVVFLPPGQTTQDGIYVSLCFGKKGNGLVTGCAISNTSKKKYADVPTVKREHPIVDVDGTRPGTHYNDGYVNPLEVLSDNFDETRLISHLKGSVTLCLDCIAKHSDVSEETEQKDVEVEDSSDPRYNTWREFLAKWPEDKFASMEIDEYTSYGEPYQSFCNWLEIRTETLGSIWGGSAYKFGVFRMQPGTKVVEDSTHDGDGTYKWYKCYGKTAVDAFVCVKQTICEIIECVQAEDLEQLDGLRFGDAVTWKIAFLYQSMEHPIVVPIYNRGMLCKLTNMPSRTPVSTMQRKLIAEKPQGMDLFAYYTELLSRLSQDDNDGEKDVEENVCRDAAVAQIDALSAEELAAFRAQLSAAGLQYSESFVRRFFAALQAKNFVVLTGLSGSGKTQLAIQFCEFMAKGRSTVVSVGADWTNNEKMLGYPDTMKQGRYVRPESGVLDLVLRAVKNPSRPYVLVLDEMNLSHVERYFADFLSAMESKGDLKLHGGAEDLDGVPPKVRMPENLWVIGTMNVDETTYMFSPKVLDRAQVLEFRVKADDMEKFLAGKQADAAATLNAFFPELAKVGSEFGYRTADEFCSFVERAIALGSPADEAVDAAVMQKLLPKLHGSRRQLERPLEALWKLCLKADIAASVETLAKAEGEIDVFPYANNCRYPISGEKIARIYKNAKDNGFASYAEA